MNGRSSQTGHTGPILRIAPVDMARDIARRKGWPTIEPLRVEPPVVKQLDHPWMLSDHQVTEIWRHESDARLRDCAEQGNLRMLRILLRQGANVRAVDEAGETAMDKARAQFHSPHISFLAKIQMAKIIMELKKAEEQLTHPEARTETVGVVVSEQLRKTGRNSLTFAIGLPLAIVAGGAILAAGVSGAVGLVAYPFEIIFGSLPKDFTKVLLEIPKIPSGIASILLTTGVAMTVASGVAVFNNFFLRQIEYRNLGEDIKTAVTEVSKTAFIFTSFSGYALGAVANIVYLAQTGMLSLAGGTLLVASSFAYRLSRFLMEKEKGDYVKFLELGARDLAIAALVTIATGAGMAFHGGIAVWTGNAIVAVGVVANYALVRWLLRSRRKSEKLKVDHLDLS